MCICLPSAPRPRTHLLLLSTSHRPVNMLYTHATIITVDSDRRIIEDGALYVQGSIIQDLGKSNVLRVRYPHEEEHDLSGHIVIPGLISTHMHTAQTLIRGTADNKELHSWLDDRIRPLLNAMTSEDAHVSVQLSVAEMLKSGTTCFLESMVCTAPLYFFRASEMKESSHSDAEIKLIIRQTVSFSAQL